MRERPGGGDSQGVSPTGGPNGAAPEQPTRAERARRLLRNAAAALGRAEEYEANARLPEHARRPLPVPFASVSSLRDLVDRLSRLLADGDL
jgi:hypothetical protein